MEGCDANQHRDGVLRKVNDTGSGGSEKADSARCHGKRPARVMECTSSQYRFGRLPGLGPVSDRHLRRHGDEPQVTDFHSIGGSSAVGFTNHGSR